MQAVRSNFHIGPADQPQTILSDIIRRDRPKEVPSRLAKPSKLELDREQSWSGQHHGIKVPVSQLLTNQALP
jgi:hypothetical protein